MYTNGLTFRRSKPDANIIPAFFLVAWQCAAKYYYALNKILNSNWLNTNLTLVDVWLGGSNVRQRNLMSG